MLPIRTILHPTDFSPHSEHACQLATALARDHGARLIVLHVVDPGQPLWGLGLITPPAPEAAVEREQDQLLQIWPSDTTVCMQHQLGQGNPALEILRAAREHDCELIVMGTHGRTGLDRLVLGSVAEAVSRQAHCAVLTVKLPRTSEPMATVPTGLDAAVEHACHSGQTIGPH